MPKGKHPNSLKNLEKRKPFVKGDPRIKPNPGGKVKSFDELRQLFQEIAHEVIDDRNEGKITRLRQMILRMSDKQIKEFMEYGYGKVPLSQIIDVTSGGKPIGWQQFINNDNDDGNTDEDKSEETGSKS